MAHYGLQPDWKLGSSATPVERTVELDGPRDHELCANPRPCGDCRLYGDNEPTIRSLLRILLNSRHAMGLRTRLYTTKVKDSAGNSLAENAIQRVRGLACTLMHGLWSWAARHACWLLNKFQATRGTTSHELVHGKPYTGALAPFGCPVSSLSLAREIHGGG